MSFAGIANVSFPSFPASGFFGVSNDELGQLGPGLIKARRQYGEIIPNVVTEEHHNDRIEITQHPVEKTASITDHAFKLPPRVTIRCGWSASSPEAQGDPNYPQSIYDQLQQMQNEFQLVDVYTGKRKYTNMLLEELSVVTDSSSEFALMAELSFQYVILVETTTTTVPSNDVQKEPADTGSTTKRGPQNALPAGTVDGSKKSLDELLLTG